MLRQSCGLHRVLSVTIGFMRWVVITFESLVTGVLAVVVSVVAFFVGLNAYTRYVFGQGSGSGAVGWDVASIFWPTLEGDNSRRSRRSFLVGW